MGAAEPRVLLEVPLKCLALSLATPSTYGHRARPRLYLFPQKPLALFPAANSNPPLIAKDSVRSVSSPMQAQLRKPSQELLPLGELA